MPTEYDLVQTHWLYTSNSHWHRDNKSAVYEANLEDVEKIPSRIRHAWRAIHYRVYRTDDPDRFYVAIDEPQYAVWLKLSI